jgi:hypothetical protein
MALRADEISPAHQIFLANMLQAQLAQLDAMHRHNRLAANSAGSPPPIVQDHASVLPMYAPLPVHPPPVPEHDIVPNINAVSERSRGSVPVLDAVWGRSSTSTEHLEVPERPVVYDSDGFILDAQSCDFRTTRHREYDFRECFMLADLAS